MSVYDAQSLGWVDFEKQQQQYCKKDYDAELQEALRVSPCHKDFYSHAAVAANYDMLKDLVALNIQPVYGVLLASKSVMTIPQFHAQRDLVWLLDSALVTFTLQGKTIEVRVLEILEKSMGMLKTVFHNDNVIFLLEKAAQASSASAVSASEFQEAVIAALPSMRRAALCIANWFQRAFARPRSLLRCKLPASKKKRLRWRPSTMPNWRA